MFCTQPNFISPCQTVSRELFGELFDSQRTRWAVESYREIKDALQRAEETAKDGEPTAADPLITKWLQSTDYQRFVLTRCQRKKGGKAFAQLPVEKKLAAFADSLKKGLAALMFQAREFDVTLSGKGYEGRWRKQASVRLSGLVVMDIDHLENPLEIFAGWKDRLTPTDGSRNWADALGIVLVYVSPGGHGLKVVFKAHTEWGNLIDNQHEMAIQLGVEVDESCKDASRMSFVSRREDILYINENELFDYENKEFAEKYEPLYREGKSQGTKQNQQTLPAGRGVAISDTPPCREQKEPALDGLYRGVSYRKIIDCWLGGEQPQPGDRHRTSLMLADHLRYICDNDARQIEAILREVPFVKDIVAERGEDVAQTVKSAMQYTYWKSLPKRLQKALGDAGAIKKTDEGKKDDGPAGIAQGLPLAAWGSHIEQLMTEFPCLREVCADMHPEGRAAALFVSAAFFGTLMTRTWWHFYHRPEEERRLNYSVIVIGDPASGKSFATRLYKLLAAPIRVADQVGYDAMNKYKREVKERSTSSKAQKGEALKKPEVIIRDHPSRTSNSQFITDMNNAVEEVCYPTHDEKNPTAVKTMHLHLLTFDSELDNSTQTQKGGSWIDKQSMELKAFHNEEDGQAYSNMESVMGVFNVYWNYIYTGTPLSLNRKVTEGNFGSGLATRLAVIPLPPSGFQMMALKRTSSRDYEAEAELKQWAFKLDQVRGELPLWPLVEECWQWASEQMAIAEANGDRAMELLMKRVPYYGICVSAPYVIMRHWKEWNDTASFTIDDTDRELCRLVLEIQFQCQMFHFGDYASHYFDEMKVEPKVKHGAAFVASFMSLPAEFGIADVAEKFRITEASARSVAARLLKEKKIIKLNKTTYRKFLSTP